MDKNKNDNIKETSDLLKDISKNLSDLNSKIVDTLQSISNIDIVKSLGKSVDILDEIKKTLENIAGKDILDRIHKTTKQTTHEFRDMYDIMYEMSEISGNVFGMKDVSDDIIESSGYFKELKKQIKEINSELEKKNIKPIEIKDIISDDLTKQIYTGMKKIEDIFKNFKKSSPLDSQSIKDVMNTSRKMVNIIESEFENSDSMVKWWASQTENLPDRINELRKKIDSGQFEGEQLKNLQKEMAKLQASFAKSATTIEDFKDKSKGILSKDDIQNIGIFTDKISGIVSFIEKEINSIPLVGDILLEKLNLDDVRKNLVSSFLYSYQDSIMKHGKITMESFGPFFDTIRTEFSFLVRNIATFANGFAKNLVNPFVIFIGYLYAAVKYYNQIEESASKFREETGIGYKTMEGIRKTSISIDKSMAKFGVTIKDVFSATVAVSDYLGIINENTGQTVKNVLTISERFGMAESESAELIRNLNAITGTSKENTDYIIASVDALSEANDVAPKKVLQDISENTESISLYMGKSAVEIAKAAILARRLGMSLGQVTETAESLLDFKNSIKAEMQAMVMLGSRINLTEARRLALNGDMVGLTKEIYKQSTRVGGFDKLNFIQKQKLAEAVGMSVSELGNMVSKQREVLEMTNKIKKGELSILEAISSGTPLSEIIDAKELKTPIENIKNAVMSLVRSISTVFEPSIYLVVQGLNFIAIGLNTIITFLNKIYAFDIVGWLAAIVVGFKTLTGSVAIVKSLTASVSGLLTSMDKVKRGGGGMFDALKKSFKSGSGGLLTSAKNFFKNIFSPKVAQAASDSVSEIGNNISETVSESLEKSQPTDNKISFFDKIINTIKEIDTAKIYALATALAALSLVILSIGASFWIITQGFETLKNMSIEEIGAGIGVFTAYMVGMFFVLKMVITGMAALAAATAPVQWAMAALALIILSIGAAFFLAGKGISMIVDSFSNLIDKFKEITFTDFSSGFFNLAVGIGILSISLAGLIGSLAVFATLGIPALGITIALLAALSVVGLILSGSFSSMSESIVKLTDSFKTLSTIDLSGFFTNLEKFKSFSSDIKNLSSSISSLSSDNILKLINSFGLLNSLDLSGFFLNLDRFKSFSSDIEKLSLSIDTLSESFDNLSNLNLGLNIENVRETIDVNRKRKQPEVKTEVSNNNNKQDGKILQRLDTLIELLSKDINIKVNEKVLAKLTARGTRGDIIR